MLSSHEFFFLFWRKFPEIISRTDEQRKKKFTFIYYYTFLFAQKSRTDAPNNSPDPFKSVKIISVITSDTSIKSHS